MSKEVREAIVEEARSFIGTPFIHQGRQKHYGVDCIGLMVEAPHNLGFECHDMRTYSRSPNPRQFMSELNQGLTELNPDQEPLPGDVAVFWTHKPHIPQHVGILAPRKNGRGFNIIHTNALLKRVVEHGLTSTWLDRVYGYWRYQGIESWQL